MDRDYQMRDNLIRISEELTRFYMHSSVFPAMKAGLGPKLDELDSLIETFSNKLGLETNLTTDEDLAHVESTWNDLRRAIAGELSLLLPEIGKLIEYIKKKLL